MRKQELKALSADCRERILTFRLPADERTDILHRTDMPFGNKISRAVQRGRRQERKRG